MSAPVRTGSSVSDQRGMTLTEVMVAVAILSVGLAALSSAIPLAAYGIQEGNQLSTATFLANQRMEQVRNATWTPCASPPADTLGVSASSTSAPVSGTGTTFPDENPVAAPYLGYTRTVRISDIVAGPTAPCTVYTGLRQVTVTVSYRPMTGIGMAAAATAKSAIVTSYVAQR